MTTSVNQAVIPAYSPVQPGAYSSVDTSALQGLGQYPGQPIPAIVGTALGGTPLTAMYFGGPGPMQQVLRGGVAFDVARFAFGAGATRVCVVRLNNIVTPVAQATIILAGASGTGLTLTSLDYGTWNNSINVIVSAANLVQIQYTDPLGVVYTESYAMGSGATAVQVANAINGLTPGFNKSNYVSALAGGGTMPLATASSAPLAGGTDGLSPAAGDWTNGFAVLETQDIAFVVPATGTASVHAQAVQHAINCSQPLARHERRVIAGGVAGESVATAMARMTGSLLSSRFQLVYPGPVDFNSAGVLTTYDPFYGAGKLAGMNCAAPDFATSLLHQLVPTYDMERHLSSVQGSDVDQLLGANVTPIAPAPGSGFWIVDSLSGYNQPDGVYRDFHKQGNADVVSQALRTRMSQRFVGKKALAGATGSMVAFASQILTDLQNSGLIVAWQTPQVTQGSTPTQFFLVAPVMLVDAVKFIFITVALQPSSTLNTSIASGSAS